MGKAYGGPGGNHSWHQPGTRGCLSGLHPMELLLGGHVFFMWCWCTIDIKGGFVDSFFLEFSNILFHFCFEKQGFRDFFSNSLFFLWLIFGDQVMEYKIVLLCSKDRTLNVLGSIMKNAYFL